jgi:sulfate transport system permease protein
MIALADNSAFATGPARPAARITRRRHAGVLPGFSTSLAITSLVVLALIVFPLAVLILRAASLGPAGFLAAAWTPRARAAYAVSLSASLIAAAASSLLGLLVAWVLARVSFPGRRILDALVDVPLALPTAVAVLVYSALSVEKGWLGQWLGPADPRDAFDAVRDCVLNVVGAAVAGALLRSGQRPEPPPSAAGAAG